MAKDKIETSAGASSASPPTSSAASDTIESLQAENAQLQEQLKNLTAKRVVDEEKEKRITVKMRAGLTRDQAIAADNRQLAYDKTPLAAVRKARVEKFLSGNYAPPADPQEAQKEAQRRQSAELQAINKQTGKN